jgi:hypothetical protein
MCASGKTTPALIECAVCCRNFLAQSAAEPHRAVCPHCGAHHLLRDSFVAEMTPRRVDTPAHAVVIDRPQAARTRPCAPHPGTQKAGPDPGC